MRIKYKEPEQQKLEYRSHLPQGTLFIRHSDSFQETPTVFMALTKIDVEMTTGATLPANGSLRICRVTATLTIEKIA